MTNFSILGTPFQIGNVTVKNRYAFSPVTTATQWMTRAESLPSSYTTAGYPIQNL